jgi:uncharacterized protein (TIGR02145 family)
MKKNLLLMMMCCPMVLAAQNGVTVSNLTVDAGTVTFNVSWNRDAIPVALWSDTVWVFVDYNNKGVMERLPVTSATASAGTVTKVPNNDKGVWVAGNARSAGSFSATVKLLTEIKDVGGACAYASNYPPVGEYSSDAPILSFTGTPMYEISLAYSGGGSTTVKSGDTFLLPCNYTPMSFTDATGSPGRLNGIPFSDNVPRYAASTKTWMVGSQIWSDAINVPECDHATYTNSNTVPYCRSYEYSGRKWFYYNGAYVDANKDILCPSPWHVPTKDDFVSLDLALGGTGVSRSGLDPLWVTSKYLDYWGAYAFFGYARGATVNELGVTLLYWSSTPYTSSNVSYNLDVRTRSVTPTKIDDWSYGFSVRCVR